MRLNAILAEHLQDLKRTRIDLDTQTKIHNRAATLGYTMSQSTIQRILRKEVHTSLDIVEQLAEIFGVAPLDLLMQKGVAADPDTMITSIEERKVLLIWRKLSDEEKNLAMVFMNASAEMKARQSRRGLRINSDASSKVPANLSAATEKASESRHVSVKTHVTHHGKEQEVPPEKERKKRSDKHT